MAGVLYVYNACIFRNIINLILIASAVMCLNTNKTSPPDEYLFLNRKQCFSSRDLFSCVKYRVSKAFWGAATNRFDYFQKENSRSKSYDKAEFGFIQLTAPSEVELFANVKDHKDDTEVMRAWKFFKRTLQAFLQGHGVEFPLLSETGAKINEISSTDLESRGKKGKKKWQIVLPLILLLKIMHLKLTLVLLLLGIGGVQIVILMGVAFIIHHLKANTFCKIHPYLVQSHSHQYSSDPEYSAFGGNYHSQVGANEFGGGYNKDWSNSKAYSGYNSYAEPSNHHHP